MKHDKHFKRLVNLNGVIEEPPRLFNECKSLVIEMIKEMDEDRVDRADMLLVLNDLVTCFDVRSQFYLDLPNRDELYGPEDWDEYLDRDTEYPYST